MEARGGYTLPRAYPVTYAYGKHRCNLMNKLMIAMLLCLCSVVQAKTFDWKVRGVNPYMGDIPNAVDDYKAEFTPAEREELKRRMRLLDYDEVVIISKYSIQGNGKRRVYDTAITKMHSGHKGVADPSRERWADTDVERGLVYCVQGNARCVLVPTVCRNVALIGTSVLPTIPHSPAPPPPTEPPPPAASIPPETPIASVPPACACFAAPAPYISDDWGLAYWGGGGYVGGFYGGGGGFAGGGSPGHSEPPNDGHHHHGHYPPPPDDCPPYTPPPVTAVPEPGTWALMLAGVAILLWKSNDRSKRKHPR